MNSPCLWFNPREVSKHLLGSYVEETSPDRFLYIRAKAVALGPSAPTFRFSAPRSKLLKLDVMPNNIRVPLISARTASLLMRICPNDFQLIPAKLQTLDAVVDECFLLNVIKEIPGMDHAQSRFVLFPGGKGIMKVERLRYAPGAMGGNHLARDSEYEPYLWASNHIVNSFTQKKIKDAPLNLPRRFIHDAS